MFYEENNISDLSNCSKCNERLDEPRVLSCGDTICSLCQSTIHVNNRQYMCIICDKSHFMPEEGLPVNKGLQKLLSRQPIQVYRSPAVESLQKGLGSIRKIMNSLLFSINNGVEKIQEECIELRNQVQLAAEQAIQQLNVFREEMLNEINQFENETIVLYQSNEIDNNETTKTVKELVLFYSKWHEYLKQGIISHEEILKANDETEKLIVKAKRDEAYLGSLVFGQGVLKFTKKPEKLENTLIGFLELDCLQGIESTILSLTEMKQLFRFCAFSLNQNWKLLYRASQNGVEAVQFHSKCDHQPNTFIVIKSTNGNVFGGYTQADWSGDWIQKNDPNAFIFSFVNTDDKPVVMKCNDPTNAIYCVSGCGPVFGKDGLDFSIHGNSRGNKSNYSNLGKSYSHPQYAYGSDEAKSFLAGSNKFLTLEIEVFIHE